MVYANINDTNIKGPFEGVKKDKNASSGHQQQQSQQQSANKNDKNDKYGSWGPVYKNKQNFIDMHIC